jgi:proliferating cell nuclear antigen
MNQDDHIIFIYYDNSVDEDTVHIDLISNSSEFDKFFSLPLADIDMNLLGIPDVEYDAEFSIPSKKICEISSQLLLFGQTMNIKCSEERIDLESSGVSGIMKVNIPIDDLSEFSISEGETIDLQYSLNYIQKMCLTTKLSNEISFSISAEFPMRIKYDLGENSHVIFFIAPKME